MLLTLKVISHTVYRCVEQCETGVFNKKERLYGYLLLKICC
ncbi:hypothetical protein PPIS_a0929 [Pseudoalteromonas piscicida]|uniref:Uncharacterized protein n=1 Tax=Pseudoalteromonas piscicida TaxID=43662 RepID=A0ABM6NBI4_PSEO7|nr:hypothetical protein PPIS_a0929 [Pseudoalteromonas piscicida]